MAAQPVGRISGTPSDIHTSPHMPIPANIKTCPAAWQNDLTEIDAVLSAIRVWEEQGNTGVAQ